MEAFDYFESQRELAGRMVEIRPRLITHLHQQHRDELASDLVLSETPVESHFLDHILIFCSQMTHVVTLISSSFLCTGRQTSPLHVPLI